jgi:hypothetical protein
MSALRVAPPNAAEILTTVVAVTALVAIVKLALVCPAGTVTLAGTLAGTVPLPPFARALESVTTAPPEGAAPVKVTVPVADAPPTRSTGLTLKALTVVDPPGVMSSSACWPGLPARSAKTFRLNCEVTGEVVIVKLALVAPAGTVTLWQREKSGHGVSLVGSVAGAV